METEVTTRLNDKEAMYTDDIIDGLEVIAKRRGKNIQQGDVLIVEAAIRALKSRNGKYKAIGHLHRPSGRITGDGTVRFVQDVFSIPLPVHGMLRVYRKEGESAE